MATTIDPIVDTSERFALGRQRSARPDTTSRPSTVRPFGLRFATALEPATGPGFDGWRLCPVRQIAVPADGQPGIVDMTMNTSGPSGDGSSGGGAEEWGPDHHDDEELPA